MNVDDAVSNGDVTDFFSNQHVDPWDSRTDLFDFDGNGDVGQGDVVELFHYVNWGRPVAVVRRRVRARRAAAPVLFASFYRRSRPSASGSSENRRFS